jgi:transcriptional regulator GlxA family with amidase domain
MKHISILVPKGAVALSCIEGSFVMFTKANDFLKSVGKAPLFDVKLVGLSHDAEVYDRLFKVYPDLTIGEVQKTDLIIIPAVNGQWDQVIETNKEFLPWIIQQYKSGSELASLCVGAFLLASTGLINGMACSTHWGAANDFKRLFPEVELVSEKIITEDKGIYSSGGASSFYNLLLYLLEKYAGREIAIIASKYFVLEIDRYSQSPFTMFMGQKDHEDLVIKNIQEFIENNFHDKITIDKLTDKFSLSRRSLERRFKKATCNTITEYLQRVKVEAAKKSFETSRKNISEVMYDVGYSDTKAFRSTFKRITGLSPIEYRNKYNRGVVAA